MEQIVFIIAMISLGSALVLFIGSILNDGMTGIRRCAKWLTGLFVVYVVMYAIYLSFQFV
ncbi:Mas-related G-protein coupled receptor member D [Salibacterium sp. K-3]